MGENFRFGHRARGDAALLAGHGEFETRVVQLVELDGEIVSSTHIRGLVATGQVGEAARLLGAPFGMRGRGGARRQARADAGLPDGESGARSAARGAGSRDLRVPRVGAGDGGVDRAVSIGVRPTFVTGRGLLVEAFLLDFAGDLYGHELRLDFISRLRGEKRFDSVDALVEQMHRDVSETRAIAAS